MRESKLGGGLVAAVCAALFCIASHPTHGGPIENVIEIDGNVLDGAGGGADWCSILAGSAANVQLFSGINADLPPLTIFTGGGSKDDLDIDDGPWQWMNGNVPNKDDIRNAAAALLVDPVSGHRVLAFFGDRHATNGDAQIGFWLFQQNVSPIGTPSGGVNGTFTGQHVNGDLLVLAHFVNGGSIGQLQVYRWNDAVTDNLELMGSSPQAGIASALNASLLGTADTCFSPGVWQFDPKQGQTNTYPENSFYEGAIDLDIFAPGIVCFHSFILETRASQSTDSVLKDFVADRFDTCSCIRGQKVEVADNGTCNTVVQPLANWEIRLYEDTNNNNVGDPLELVTTDGNGASLTNPRCTDSNGRYEFCNLPNGRRYIVCELVPNRLATENFNWVPCLPGPADGHLGANLPSTVCAGQNPSGGREFCYNAFTLTGDTERNFRNFRQVIVCDLAVTKFCDVNGNGVLNPPDDVTLPGFCFCVTNVSGGPSPNPPCRVTDATGIAVFTVATGYSYSVVEDLDGSSCLSANQSAIWVPTTPTTQSIVIPPAASNCQASFGNASRPTVSCGSGNVTRPTDPGLCTAHFCFTPSCSNLCGTCSVNCNAVGPSGQSIPLTPGTTAGQLCGDFPGPATPGCGPAVSTVTCTATSQAGLTATCSFTVTVTDNQPPTITCSAVGGNVDANCQRLVTFSATVTDNCCVRCDDVLVDVILTTGNATIGTPTVTRTPNGQNQCLVSGSVLVSALTSCPATVRVTVNARDCCNNSATPCVASANVTDVTPPVISACTVNGGAVDATCCRTVTFSGTVIDNCCVRPDDVTVNVSLTTANATLGTPSITKTQNGQNRVDVTGSVSVCALTSCPATVRLRLNARDCCNNLATEVSCTGNVTDETPPNITCPSDQIVACNQPIEVMATASDNCDPSPTCSCTFTDTASPDRFTVVSLGNCRYRLTLTGTTVVTGTCTATDDCNNTSTQCQFNVSATCNQACSPGFWRNHNNAWCPTGFNPVANFCFSGAATRFVDAFMLTNLSAAPGGFNTNITLLEAVSLSGGAFNQCLFHGSAALLSASHPQVSFGHTAAEVRGIMQQAFAGTITFSSAANTFASFNAAESQGGCPLN